MQMSITCWLVRRERYVRLRATVSGSSGRTGEISED